MSAQSINLTIVVIKNYVFGVPLKIHVFVNVVLLKSVPPQIHSKSFVLERVVIDV
jgi:hypothetical protein